MTTDKCLTCESLACISLRGYRCPEALVEVDGSKWEAFEKAFSKLARRAAKLGAELPSFEVVTEYTVVHFARDGAFGLRYAVGGSPVKAVRVTGPRPKFAGWSLLATLEPLETKTSEGAVTFVNLIKSIPGAGDLPESLRTGVHCDHCKTVRRRAETFVVRHEDGRLMRVGRQCIGDFLGGASPEMIALHFALATTIATLGGDEDSESWGPRAPSVWELAAYVGLVIRDIKASGWCPRSAARNSGGQATADSAFLRMMGNPLMGLKPEKATAEELEVAKTAIGWACALESRSDFDHNIQAIARSGNVAGKTLGMAAAIFGAYEREQAREVARRELANKTAASVHVGVVKGRLDLTLTCTKVIDLESQWGATHLHMFTDASGNAFKWFASSERLDVGAEYTVRATVKAHGEYKGRLETVLTRCACTLVGVAA
jgi:hypothetical protein